MSNSPKIPIKMIKSGNPSSSPTPSRNFIAFRCLCAATEEVGTGIVEIRVLEDEPGVELEVDEAADTGLCIIVPTGTLC